ncbi:MAG: kinase-like domain-containing protein [Monoraphidium minutum]|nr:MAG: kinase-like domain-containing protein [Monoraphidium minutum]
MELADRGTLQDAIDMGWLEARSRPGISASRVTATALEVARGMRALHRAGVVHGDLHGYNVLLSSHCPGASTAGRGFGACIADVGLSRAARRGEDLLSSNPYGLVAHTAPEVLQGGPPSKAADVYSFGVLLWSMATGSRPWAGVPPAAIVEAVSRQGGALAFPHWAPLTLRDLGESCLASDPATRPAFSAIQAALEDFLLALQQDHFEDL